MQNEKRLEVIRYRLKEIESIQDPLWDEVRSLEQERDKIYTFEAIELAKSTEWELEYYDKRVWKRIKLSCRDRETRDKMNEILWTLGGDYHKTYYVDKDGDVTLNMDDGDIYFSFDNMELYKKYTKELGLKVDTSSFREHLVEFKKEIELLEEFSEK